MHKEFTEENFSTIILTGTIIVIIIVAFVILLSVLFTAKKNKLLQEKQIMKTQFNQALLQTQIEIQEQTLKTISAEIHDNVGQVLSLAKLNLNTFNTITDEPTQTKISDTKNLVAKAINDLRNLSRSLYGDKIADLGLPDAISNEFKILENSGQYNTALKIIGESYKLDPQKQMVLFRIVQEAMNNTIKHARAKNIQVTLDYKPELFTLTIADDGTGFDPSSLLSLQTGIGLKSMQNRAALIGGQLTIHSSENTGTTLSIVLPITLKSLNP